MNDFGFRMLNRAHRALLTVTRGRVGARLGSMPVIELHTIGHTSGVRRSVMLTAPLHEPGRYVLVASKGGNPRHPQWYVNLVAHPDIEITVGGKTRPMRARTAGPDERPALWAAITKVYAGYAQYQRKTSREIPVVICEARDARA